MSVKFEKETIQQTGGMAGTQGPTMMKGAKHPVADEIGTALTGGKGNVGTKGYLAVSLAIFVFFLRFQLLIGTPRPISTSSRRILYGRRCLQPEVFRLRKNFLPLGSQRTETGMGVISLPESPRWPRTVHSSALLWAMFSSAYFRECLLVARV